MGDNLQEPDELIVREKLVHLTQQLYPIRRSLTGDGVRRTLDLVQRYIPVQRHEVATGTPVLDWQVPQEWNLRSATITDANGNRIVDTSATSLHVVGYSTPLRATMPLEALRPHLYSLPDRPDWIPYRTSYYSADWGFCLPHRVLARLTEGDYTVSIDADLVDGSLSYGELVVPGASEDVVLITTHICHPELANDNASGMAVATLLAQYILDRPRRLTYRFLFIPGTIGSLTWLSRNPDVIPHIRHGLVLNGLGDSGPLTYKRSRRGDAVIDRAAAHVLRTRPHELIDFYPFGYDERQFCSPGFNLPVGRLSRSLHGEYPEYHTSADDLTFVRADSLVESFSVLVELVQVIERDRSYANLFPYGEPQLGRRGLYRSLGATVVDRQAAEMALLWVLNLSDDRHSLLDIAVRADLPFASVAEAADRLSTAGLIRPTR